MTYDAVYTFANALALLRKWGQARQGMNRTALSQALLQVNFAWPGAGEGILGVTSGLHGKDEALGQAICLSAA